MLVLRLLCGLGMIVLLARPAIGGPVTIDLLASSYATELSTSARFHPLSGIPPYAEQRSQVSPTPISDAIVPVSTPEHPLRIEGQTWAAATADLFTVVAEGNTMGCPMFACQEFSGAMATTTHVFTTATNASTTIGIDILGGGSFFFSGGFIKLTDLTTAIEVWNYGWSWPSGGMPFTGNVPWDRVNGTATIDVSTAFLASHLYALTLNTWISSNNDPEYIKIEVSGLEPRRVPEPATLSLLGLSAAAIFGWRHRRNRLNTTTA